ncbi:MAG: F0F1 ATP synthase subunit delta [Ornithinimicrobium sp.]
MEGTSRSSLKDARRALNESVNNGADAAQLGEDLLAVAGVVGGSAVLRRAVADPSRDGKDRAGLIDRLFVGRITDAAQEVARVVAAARWTRDADVSQALELLAVEAILAHAQEEGRLSRVEDELFRFNRIVSATPALQAALSDGRATPSAKGNLVKALISDKVAPESLRLAQHAVATPTMRFDRAIPSYLDIAAQRQSQVTAVVTSARALSAEHKDRMVDALSKQYGRDITLQVVVDESVLGGIRVEIADEVIEGTISSRLSTARRHVAR